MFKKLFLVLISFLLISVSIGQYQYQTNRWYAYQGQTYTDVTYRSVYNYNTNRYEYIKYCRTLNWYRQYYSGNVYYQDIYGNWYTQYNSGYFWYCTWTGWYRCF